MKTFYVQRIETIQIWGLGHDLIRLSMESEIERRASRQGYVLMPMTNEEITWMAVDPLTREFLSVDEENATHVRVTAEREGYPDTNPVKMCTDCGELQVDPNKNVCWKCAFK